MAMAMGCMYVCDFTGNTKRILYSVQYTRYYYIYIYVCMVKVHMHKSAALLHAYYYRIDTDLAKGFKGL